MSVSCSKFGKDEKSAQMFTAQFEGRLVDEKYY